jgi:glycosyltransferase involved in cell wall biosynthesis
VATDVGGVREWLAPDETGLLVPRRDADGLAAALDRLAADRDLVRRLGAAGARRVAERFRPAGHLARLRAALAGAT